MYFFEHGAGDANADNAAASTEGGNEDGYEITLTGAVPMVEGLSLGVGYAELNKSSKESAGISDRDQLEATMYAKYSVGAFSIGAQRGVVNQAGANDLSFDLSLIHISEPTRPY